MTKSCLGDWLPHLQHTYLQELKLWGVGAQERCCARGWVEAELIKGSALIMETDHGGGYLEHVWIRMQKKAAERRKRRRRKRRVALLISVLTVGDD